MTHTDLLFCIKSTCFRKHHPFVAIMVVCCIFLLLMGCAKNENLSVVEVTLSSNSLTMKPGDTQTLSVNFFPRNAANQSATWSATDTSIVKVSSSGVVTAIRPGSSKVKVISQDTNESDSCSITVDPSNTVSVSGDISGTWPAYSVIHVDGQVNIPAGKTLTIEKGVQVIINTAGQDANNTKIELIVKGNLYCYGTEADPVLFSVASASRTTANTFGRLWGGIIGATTCSEMVLDHTIVEYTGAITTTTSQSAVLGLFKSAGGEGMVAFNTNNPSGKYVVTNSVFRNTGEDAIYVQGGSCIFTYNKFYAVGSTGGEAINVKAGCVVDAAYNLMYSPNTNAFKLSSSGQSTSRPQAKINAYNNTILNAGWRRDPTDPKGGSVWAEKGALVNVVNNLIVNCMFGIKAPSFGVSATTGPALASVIDYNYYASGTQSSTVPQHIANGTATAYAGFKAGVTNVVYGAHDKAGAGVGLNDPTFTNFPFFTNPLLSYTFDSSWDFHLKSGSPAVTGGTTLTPYFNGSGLVINGITYKSPLSSVCFGAFGTN
ncbi:MAG: hypothetical protein H6Q17_587 [Bacteroidetes bacterium]|nr:hypothetical protein [Bacteroidota bacterium]